MADEQTNVQTEPQAAEQQVAEPKPEPKYTDEQFNAKAMALEKKVQRDMMERLGVKTPEELDALKKLREEKMTDSEKALAREKEKDEAINAAKAEAEGARAEAEALKRGVPADKVERLVKIAKTYDGTTIAEKLDAALKDFPEFIGKGQGGGGQNLGKETTHQNQSEEERLIALARKHAGLTK